MNRESNPQQAVLLRVLEQLEGGHVDAARQTLREALGTSETGPVEPVGPVSEGELDRALAQAAPDVERMVHADDVAQAAIRQADAELQRELAPAPLSSTFQTATMAELLERQGEREEATRIRTNMAQPVAPGSEGPEGRSERRILHKLESWLENLRERPRSGAGPRP